MSGAAQRKRTFGFARARRRPRRALRPDGHASRKRQGALQRQGRIERLGLPYFAGASRWLRRSSAGETSALEGAAPAPEGAGGSESPDRAPRFGLRRALRRQVEVGAADDPLEREAEAVADGVGGGHDPAAVSRLDGEGTQSAAAAGGAALPTRAATAETIERPGLGSPMAPEMRRQIEPRVGADLGHVRVHSDGRAQRAASDLNARAFASGPNIFLGRGESPGDRRLMAHEAAHVVQQGAATGPAAGVRPKRVQRLLGIIRDRLASYARHIPGYTLFTVVIGFNPLSGRSVDRNATNLIEGLMGLVPFGTAIFDKLREHGILQDAFTWVRSQLDRLDLSVGRIERTLEEAWEDVDLLEGFSYNLGVLERHFGRLLRDVTRFAESLVDHLVEMIKEVAISLAERLLEGNQAWELIKKILHYDPLRGEEVHATTVEILEDFLILIGKETELEQMRVRGTLQETADWLDTQLGTFNDLLSTLTSLFADAWEAIQPRNLPNLADNLSSLAERAFGFLERVWDFALTVASTVLKLIKDALLSWLKSFATDIPGYHLMTVILGRDPFTEEEVPRTPTNLIRGFMSLMPGGEAQFQELRASGVIGEAAQRIENAMSRLGITWEGVVGLFLGIWEALSIDDLIDPIGAFRRITDSFGGYIRRLFEFIVEVIKVVVELVLELMNFPSEILGRIISNTIQAIEDIKRDPVGFIKNLLRAVKLGFTKFFDNILQHLLGGLTEWLFGNLRKAGIEPPSEITLESVLDLVMQVLGITAERLWEKLAERIGQDNVDRIRGALDRLRGIWTFVRDVQERGVAAIWERIQEQISGLWDMVIEKARDWIVTRVIERVVTKLISMLDPTGVMAVVNSFIAFFNAVQSAIEYFREMLEIVDDYVSTLAAVARGEVEPGAVKLESGLARAIPVAIGFLANQVGLGNLAEKLQEILASLRAVVDRAIDWLMDRAVNMGRSFLNMLGVGTGEEETAEAEDAEPESALGDLEESFTEEDDSTKRHRLYVAERGGSLTLMIASVPQTYEEFIDGADESTDETRAAKAAALPIARQIDEALTVPPSEESGSADEIRGMLDRLADHTAVLFGGSAGASSPPIWGPSSAVGFGTRMTIEYLTAEPAPGVSGGAPTSAFNEVWDNALIRRRQGGRSYYVKGHLLSQKLEGKGDWINLTPLFQNSNQEHERVVESKIKEGIEDPGRAFRYVVDAVYGRGVNTGLIDQIDRSGETAPVKELKKTIVRAEAHVPRHLAIEAVELDPGTRQPMSGGFSYTQPLENQVDQSSPAAIETEGVPRPAPVNVNDPDGLVDRLQTIPGIGPVLAREIADKRAGRERPWGRYSTLAREVEGISLERFEAWAEEGLITLGS